MIFIDFSISFHLNNSSVWIKQQTFMLPSMTFSPYCRSTLNGISAACGKVGAVLGASLFEPAATYLGNDTVLMICSAISILGGVLTWICVTPNVGLGRIDSLRIDNDVLMNINFSRNRNKSSPSFLDYNG